MKKRSVPVVIFISIMAICFFLTTSTPIPAQVTMAGEKAAHPRIMKAIKALEDAVAYMKAAPHDFGGHRAAAIADSEKAITQLKEALKYREMQDEKKVKNKNK